MDSLDPFVPLGWAVERLNDEVSKALLNLGHVQGLARPHKVYNALYTVHYGPCGIHRARILLPVKSLEIA